MNKKYKIIILLSIIVCSWVVILLFLSFKEKTYSLKKYYPNKTIKKAEFECVIRNGDTLFQGKFVRYNEKGNKIADGNFVNDELKVKNVYFENGIIESTYRYENNFTQENIDNFPSGKIMRYTSYDDNGLSAFIIRFDEEGNPESYTGFPIMEMYQYKINNNEKFKIKINQYLKIGDTLKHKYIVADIPNAKSYIKSENLSVDDTKVKRIYKRTSRNGLDVKEILIKKGINNIRTFIEYKFNNKAKTVIRDTVSFKVFVNQ